MIAMHGILRTGGNCSKMCPVGKKHRGVCVVNGKMLKPDRMRTDADDEPADEPADKPALGADRVLRKRKHPMEKFLEDAESRLNTPQPETPPSKEKKRKATDADTDASAKKKLTLEKENEKLKKEMAALKKQLAQR